MREFFQVISIEAAIRAACSFPRTAAGTVPLASALGRVLARDVTADLDVPGFDRATMDGLAVRARDTCGASENAPALLSVTGSVAMGGVPSFSLAPGQAAQVATGAMLPEGADAVVMAEHTETLDETLAEVCRSVAPLANVTRRGEDARAGETLLAAGIRLRPQDLALAAAAGRVSLHVFDRPRAAVLSTGDEVVPPEAAPAPGQIRDMNSCALCAQLEEAGAEPRALGIIPDDAEALYAACMDALAWADILLVSGGSSIGSRDHTLAVLERLPDAEILFHGVSISPGKPVLLARSGTKAVWGLPGNVVSAMVVFETLVRPQAAHIGGMTGPPAPRPHVMARLARNVHSVPGRRDFIRARLVDTPEGPVAEPLFGKSGIIRTMVEARGMFTIGENTEGLDAGALVKVVLF
jgi:molybdopterin molybdotransferase